MTKAVSSCISHVVHLSFALHTEVKPVTVKFVSRPFRRMQRVFYAGYSIATQLIGWLTVKAWLAVMVASGEPFDISMVILHVGKRGSHVGFCLLPR